MSTTMKTTKTVVTRTAKDNKTREELPPLHKFYREARQFDGPVAEVSATVDFKITANFQSVGVSVSVTLPVEPSITEVEQGQDLVLELARKRLQKEINLARKDLAALTELRKFHE